VLDALILEHAVSMLVTAQQCSDSEDTHLYSLCMNAV
jgi:hypothetical protein